MQWNIAQAKQRFSEVVKQAAVEPQLIYNRSTPVAAVIAAEDLADYQHWKAEKAQPTSVADEFAKLRQILREEGIEDGLDIPPRVDRPNAFMQMLETDHPELLKTGQ